MRKILSLPTLFFYVASFAQQPFTYTVNYKLIGNGYSAIAMTNKTESAFSIGSRLLPGLPFKLLATDNAVVKGDSVSGKLHIATYHLHFKGLASSSDVSLQLFDIRSNEPVGSIVGNTGTIEKKDYVLLAKQIIDSTEKLIFNKAFTESKEWGKFRSNLLNKSAIMQDDIEMMLLFFTESKKLPFSHFDLTKLSDAEIRMAWEGAEDDGQTAGLSNLENNIALLQVKSFGGDGHRIDSLMRKVIADKSKHLIIDLRGNSGGNAGSAMQLSQYLLPENLPVGAMVTRQWFNTHTMAPTPDDYKNLVKLTRDNSAGMARAFSYTPGFVLSSEPAKKQFKGNIYVLTDAHTASTSEPFVYELKRSKRAVIVGEKTAGAMLAKVPVPVMYGYVVFIPMADYFASDGMRLDQVGVTPDVAVPAQDALAKAIELINTSSK